jgi:hypothetical protein
MMTIDGKNIPEYVLRQCHITTDVFEHCRPNDNVLNFPAGCGRDVNDVYGVIISPHLLVMDSKCFQLLEALHQDTRRSYRSLPLRAALTATAVHKGLKCLH